MSLIQQQDTLPISGVTMASKHFRRCIFILDELLSCYDCFQFLAAVPLTALVYHKEIKNPMDFKTLEKNLFSNKYKEYNDFVQDLCFIWDNAKLFHRSFDLIYQQAENLFQRYTGLDEFLKGGPKPFYLASSMSDIDLILDTPIPEENLPSAIITTTLPPPPEPNVIFPMYKELDPPNKSNLYFVQALSEQDSSTKKLRGFSNVRLLFQHLNASFFEYMAQPVYNTAPLPRFYIAKNRTLLNEAGIDPEGVLAVLCNVQIKPLTRDLYRWKATVVMCEPMGETHGFDESSMDKSDEYEFCPKAWLKLRVIKVVHNVNTVIHADMDRSFFKKFYNTYKLSTKSPTDLKKVGNHDVAKEFVQSILNPVSNATTPPPPPVKKSKLPVGVVVEKRGRPKKQVKKALAMPSTSAPAAIKQEETQQQEPVPVIESCSSPVSAPPTDHSGKFSTTIRLVLNKPKEQPKSIDFSSPLGDEMDVDKDDKKEEESEEEETDTKEDYKKNDDDHADHQNWYTDEEDAVNSTTTDPNSNNNDQLTKTSVSFERYMQEDPKEEEQVTTNNKQYYINASKELWKKLQDYAKEKNVPVVDINTYADKTSSFPNAEGFFKHVYFLTEDSQKVVQTFRRMTITQRTTEIASLLALKGLPHMGQITQVLEEGHGEIIGLAMQRYQKTLKQYTHAHSHHRLTAHQKMNLVIQMLQCIETIHKIGLAHRDLSEVNFMVNETDTTLRDGSPRAELVLIDFGKSAFTTADNVQRWWIEHPTTSQQEIVPLTRQDLDIWCQQLPWIRSKPDHGYRLYRSVQTLPKNRTDTDDLPWLVNPLAEDIYSLGTIIWKTFSETEPWYGILDTDLKGLRQTVGEDYHIENALQREVPGKLSKQLLLKCLKVSPDQRASASEILAWLNDIEIQDGLIAEWEEHAPVGRQKRHAKALFRYDDEQAAELASKKTKMNPPGDHSMPLSPPNRTHVPLPRKLAPRPEYSYNSGRNHLGRNKRQEETFNYYRP